MVGDPSGKDDMRKMLTPEFISHNIACFKKQMARFIDFSEGQAIMNRYGRKTNYVGLTSEEAARIGKPASPTDTMIIVAFFVSVVCSIVAPCIWVAAGALGTCW